LASTAAVLAVLAFQPVIHATTTETIRGRVVVALDRSASMVITDPQRPLIDKLRIARALKLATDICPDRQLDAWIEEAAANGQVTFPLNASGTDDRVRQMFEGVRRRIDALSRGRLGDAIIGDSGRLLEAIESKHDTALIGFADTAFALPHQSNPPSPTGSL